MKLSKFLAEIGRSGVEAAEAAQKRARRHYLSRFETDKKGDMRPVTVNFRGLRDGRRGSKIPKASLTTPAYLGLKGLEIEFETDLTLDEDVPVEGDALEPSRVQIGLTKGLFRRKTHARVRAVFNEISPPEGILKIEDSLNARLKQELE